MVSTGPEKADVPASESAESPVSQEFVHVVLSQSGDSTDKKKDRSQSSQGHAEDILKLPRLTAVLEIAQSNGQDENSLGDDSSAAGFIELTDH